MRKRQQVHLNHERWLVSYADFITLLFAFFVVLYLSSQVDKRKAGRLALAIQVAFQELGVFQTFNTKIPIKDEEAIPFENVQVVENINKDADPKRIVNPMKGVLSSAGEASRCRKLRRRSRKLWTRKFSGAKSL